ncbi:hypothetical protein [Bifidobacterium crudilactis]
MEEVSGSSDHYVSIGGRYEMPHPALAIGQSCAGISGYAAQ